MGSRFVRNAHGSCARCSPPTVTVKARVASRGYASAPLPPHALPTITNAELDNTPDGRRKQNCCRGPFRSLHEHETLLTPRLPHPSASCGYRELTAAHARRAAESSPLQRARSARWSFSNPPAAGRPRTPGPMPQHPQRWSPSRGAPRAGPPGRWPRGQNRRPEA